MASPMAVTGPAPAAAVADACLRLGAELRVAPLGLRPVSAGMKLSGPAIAVRHYGSVDVFLEAFDRAKPNDVLVIDNGGQTDEGCIGDLTTLEAKTAGVQGLVVWGAHRDTSELVRIGLPVFSYGHVPNGPVKARPRPSSAIGQGSFGPHTVRSGDVVVADDDGAVFVPASEAQRVLAVAHEIATRERAQAERIRAGTNLRSQLRFADFLAARAKDPKLTFRDHIRKLGGEIEQ